MSTNHNRIKVSDLETGEPNKTLITNDNGELQFSKIPSGSDSFFESGSGANSIVLKNKHNDATTGIGAVVLGQSAKAPGVYASSIGLNTTASGYWSHAQGNYTKATNFGSHAQGVSTISSGYSSHAQGEETIAGGDHSFAGGLGSYAYGESSFAFGMYSTANEEATIVLGSNITGNQPNTTYVDNLNIKTLGYAQSENNLGIDINGNIVSASPQDLQKTLEAGNEVQDKNIALYISNGSSLVLQPDGIIQGQTIVGSDIYAFDLKAENQTYRTSIGTWMTSNDLTINTKRTTTGNITFNYPEHAAGNYTLATTADIYGQLEIGTNQTISSSWHGKTIFFTANCTITVPAALPESFIFNGITLAGVTVTWAITAPHTWLFGTPAATTEKQIFTFTKRGSTNSVLLLGV